MRRLFATLAIFAATTLICAGSPGADSNIYTLTGRIENIPSGNGDFTLKVITQNDYMPKELIASTQVLPDGFFLVDIPGSLDETVTTRYFEDPADGRYYGEGVTISNIDMKFSSIRLAIYSGDEYLGEIRYGTPEDYGRFFYFDGDCDLIGSHYRRDLDINQIYDLNIKKGWNWLYGTHVWNGPDGNVITVESKSVAGTFRFFPF